MSHPINERTGASVFVALTWARHSTYRSLFQYKTVEFSSTRYLHVLSSSHSFNQSAAAAECDSPTREYFISSNIDESEFSKESTVLLAITSVTRSTPEKRSFKMNLKKNTGLPFFSKLWLLIRFRGFRLGTGDKFLVIPLRHAFGICNSIANFVFIYCFII